MRSFDAALMLTVAHLSMACISAGGRPPERLYPPTAQPLRAEQVSKLSGYVQFVDNQDVASLASAFELLPGCHVIGTPSSWGQHAPGTDSVVTATTGHWLFALPMRAGHQYSIQVLVGAMTGPVGALTIKGYESDLAGNVTRAFEPVRNPSDLQNCRAEAAHPAEIEGRVN